jgi:hypothetical protein
VVAGEIVPRFVGSPFGSQKKVDKIAPKILHFPLWENEKKSQGRKSQGQDFPELQNWP